jgi:cell wall-associated NlpC family hydrolase
MPSGRHSRPHPRPDSHPVPTSLALCAVAVSAVVATPTEAQAAPAKGLVEAQQVGALDQGAGVATGAVATNMSDSAQLTRQTIGQSRIQYQAAVVKARAKAAAVSRRARKAVAYAKAHLDDQYGWAGKGPRYFDCSGLTMMAWRQGGVRLPHRAKLQHRRGSHVPKSRLRPGDLVFFYRSKSHVGIYIGGGKMIHAANRREDIKISTISRGYYARKYVGARHIA